jgi:hypothetical protein
LGLEAHHLFQEMAHKAIAHLLTLLQPLLAEDTAVKAELPEMAATAALAAAAETEPPLVDWRHLVKAVLAALGSIALMELAVAVEVLAESEQMLQVAHQATVELVYQIRYLVLLYSMAAAEAGARM